MDEKEILILKSVQSNSEEINVKNDISTSRSYQQLIESEDDENNDADNSILLLDTENDSIIDDLFNKNQVLQTRWKIMENRVDKLKKENDKLNQLLLEEKGRCAKYQKKLQYIQENQPLFEKLKQAYMSMKYNESAARPIVEVDEKFCQTCNGNNVADNISFNLSDNINFDDEECDIVIEPGYIPIKKKEFNGLKKTVHILKDLIISQPLSTFVLSENKEAKYRKDICDLFTENQNLKQMVIDQQMQLDTTKQQLAIRKTQKETNLLKKIIAKLEKQIRSCNNCADQISKPDSAIELNAKERKVIDHISAKYELKLLQKSEFLKSIDYDQKNSTPYFTPRTPTAGERESYRSCDDTVSIDTL